MATNMRGGLRRLSEMENYEVEAGYLDIRGWELRDRDDRDIGSVTDLLIDTARDEAVSVIIHRRDRNWFLELFTEEENGRLPLSAITLDEPNQVVRVTRPLEEVLSSRTEADERGAGGAIGRDVSGGTATGATATSGMAAGGAAATGAAATGQDEAIDVIEERLEIEKERRKAGEVRIGKTVERETVRREVPVEREEVIVEREPLEQPIAATEAASHLEGREGEIIVPIYREEIEVTTRPVIAERLRIKKRMVQETREVAADVRREHATVEGTGAVEESGRTAPEGGSTRRRA